MRQLPRMRGKSSATLTQMECDRISQASTNRCDKQVLPGEQVHKDCRHLCCEQQDIGKTIVQNVDIQQRIVLKVKLQDVHCLCRQHLLSMKRSDGVGCQHSTNNWHEGHCTGSVQGTTVTHPSKHV